MHRHEFVHFFGGYGRGGLRHFGGGGFFGGPGGRFRGGGPGMRPARVLASGDLQLVILLLLGEKPRHGYEVIKAIEEHSSGIYTPSPGMVYPALTYLEETGFAAAAAEGTKKLYNITPSGADELARHRAAADEVWNQLALFGRRLAHVHKQFAEDEDILNHFGSGPGGTPESDWHQVKAEFRELRDQLKAAIYEKLSSSIEEKKRVLQILRRTIEEIRGK